MKRQKGETIPVPGLSARVDPNALVVDDHLPASDDWQAMAAVGARRVLSGDQRQLFVSDREPG